MAGTTTTRRTVAEKNDARRIQLAESALRTLGELGYARTSLREIAHNSEFTHGVVHYYFRDKHDLIVTGLRHYKAQCVTRYDDVVATATGADELADGFVDKLVETIVDEAPMHRLWYDLRAQSMFEVELREAVLTIDATLEQMIWRVLTRYAELVGRAVRVPSAAAYALLDGLFQQALLGHLTDRAEALVDLGVHVRDLLPHLLEPSA
ncbi:TetR/AcrR family transcriptional regulator [Nocardioides alkalitolerans]|uniref:TetR/AcrR family transcriptional regulator n=1 Tax=Nocardioides alkalitolerans TaxID=281714 RepID=UPI0004059735|nr:TetR/AcrR family transcriptional regulator [Nocardioides alkalitolerans]